MPADPHHILNWRRIDARLTTSGQPDAAGFGQIRACGVQHVLNLAPADSKDALPDEAALVTGLGMGYTHIPVDFEAPTESDFADFCSTLATTSDQKLHIHCIYNARVSAFLLRYSCDGRGGNPAEIEKIMDTIWRPGGVWASYIGRPQDSALPNRYAGYDY